MNSRSMILSVMREQGKTDARQLRERAPNMDGTALIAEEQKIPLFDPQKDYSGWPIGAPVLEEVGGEMQAFGLTMPPTIPARVRPTLRLCGVSSIPKIPRRQSRGLRPTERAGCMQRMRCAPIRQQKTPLPFTVPR